MSKIEFIHKGDAVYAKIADLYNTEPNRDMGDLAKLKMSIEAIGMITPIAVDETGKLLAGRRRIACAKELEWELIEVRVYPDGDPLRDLRISIDENVRRKNFTDPEQASFLKQLHEILQDKAVETALKESANNDTEGDALIESLPADAPIPESVKDQIWSQKDTAKEIGASQQTVSSAVTIATMVEEQPELAKQTGTVIMRMKRRETARKEMLEKGIEKAPDYLRSANFWYFNDRDPRYGTPKYKHGVVPGQAVENLMWVYTDVGDLVVDPMCGGGTFLDVAIAWQRPCIAYDIDPIRDDIKKHDIWKGLPKECKGAKLIYLDPPYFNMVQDFFGDVLSYFKFQDHIIDVSAKTVAIGGYVAFIIMDYSNRDDTGLRYGAGKSLIGEVYKTMVEHPNLVFEACISVPLPQAGFRYQPFELVKKQKDLCGLNRIIWVFKRVK
jgi:ParB-like chromosome segregation protein Spo0J